MAATGGPTSASDYEVFNYLTADKAGAYRAVMRAFLDAKERFRLHLRPEDLVVILDDDAGVPDRDEARALLGQLVQWGALRADVDTAEVDSVEEFYRQRYLYQLTAEGESAERAVRHFEDSLVRPGELQTAALSDIRALLAELRDLADAPGLDAAKAHRVLRELGSRFEELTDRAQVFMGDLQRTIDLQGLEVGALVAYKDLLIDYLQRFIGELRTSQFEIAGLLEDIRMRGVQPLLRAAADRELEDALEVTDEGRAEAYETWQRRWDGLAAWFTADGPDGDAPQVEVLRARARSAIPALLQAVARINEQRISHTDRPADLRTLARWFADCRTDADAHRLWRAAFGLAPARHLEIDQDTLDARGEQPVAPSTSFLDAEPLCVSPRLRRTGHYLRRGRINSVVDRSRDKQRLARAAAEEAAQLAAARARLATDGTVRLSALGELPRDAFDLLLDLLGEALARKVRPADTVRTTTADGSLQITLAPIDDGTTATIVTGDGALTGRDHHVTIVDLLSAGPKTAPAGRAGVAVT